MVPPTPSQYTSIIVLPAVVFLLGGATALVVLAVAALFHSFVTFHSHFSLFSLFSLCVFVMAPGYAIGMFSFSIFYMHSIFICHILLGTLFICILHLYSHFWSLSGPLNPPPSPQEPGFHPGDEPFDPDLGIPPFPNLAIV
jgi:hypothetical protein